MKKDHTFCPSSIKKTILSPRHIYKIRNMHTWQLNSDTYCIAFRIIYNDDRTGGPLAANACQNLSNQLRHLLTKGDHHNFKYCFIDMIAASNIDYSEQTELFPVETMETTMDISLRNSRPSDPYNNNSNRCQNSGVHIRPFNEMARWAETCSPIIKMIKNNDDNNNNNQSNSPVNNINNQVENKNDRSEYDNICANSQMDDICQRIDSEDHHIQ